MIHIRNAGPRDYDSIWQIIHEVSSKGDTYVFDPDSSRKEMLDYWCGNDKHCYVAEIEPIRKKSFSLCPCL